MKHQILTKYTDNALILKALAHSGRLALLEALANGEKCVSALQEILGCEISTISKHLALLKKVGILESRRQGLNIFYRIRIPCLLRFLDCVANFVIQRAQAEDQFSCCALSLANYHDKET